MAAHSPYAHRPQGNCEGHATVLDAGRWHWEQDQSGLTAAGEFCCGKQMQRYWKVLVQHCAVAGCGKESRHYSGPWLGCERCGYRISLDDPTIASRREDPELLIPISGKWLPVEELGKWSESLRQRMFEAGRF